MRGRSWLLAGCAVLLVARTCGCGGTRQTPLSFATFNIHGYPREGQDEAEQFALMKSLGVGFLAVQEIEDPERFRRAARERLGPTWELIHDERSQNGVPYDSAVWEVKSSAVHDETGLGAGFKPTLEVRMAPRSGGPVVRLFVVHFKSGGEDSRPTRRLQFEALRQILEDARRSGERLAVLGDFNTTEPGDFDDLARIARTTGLFWVSDEVPCTEYWIPAGSGCSSSKLDHALVWAPARSVVVGGECAKSCPEGGECPVYRTRISDHCPVRVTM